MAVFSDKEELIICKKKLMSLLSVAILHIHLQENLLRNVLRSPEVNRGRKSLSCHQAFFYSRDLELEKRINKVEQTSVLKFELNYSLNYCTTITRKEN